MTITLTEETAAYVKAQLETGAFETPEEVVEALIKFKPPLVCCDREGNPLTREELETELLKAVRGPHAPWRGREMTVTLPKEIEEFVQTKLSTGSYENADEVVFAALRNWQGEEMLTQYDQDEVEALLLEAIDSPRSPWRREELDEIIERLRAKYGDR